MFILTKFADLVQIAPEDFSKHSAVAIEDNINEKYANRVVQKIGLCIVMYDLLWASEGLIGHRTGMVNVNVEFRMVVFRPFKGEVILGYIKSSTPDGINIKTDFFENIFVPYRELPQGVEYSHAEQIWVWNTEDQTLYYDTNEPARVQITEEEWHDQTPEGPNQAEETVQKIPYKIRGTMMAEGLGPVRWWDYDD